MNIKIVCVGKLKENYWTQAVEEYLKRIGRFAKIEVAELKEIRISDRPSKAEEEAVKKSEGEEILKKIKKDDYCITLEIKGKQLSSEPVCGEVFRTCPCRKKQHSLCNRRFTGAFAGGQRKSRLQAVIFTDDISTSDDESCPAGAGLQML